MLKLYLTLVLYLICINKSLAEEYEDDNEVYKYRDKFFVGNKSFSLEHFNNMVTQEKCVTVPFTDIYRMRGCFPVYVQNKLCSGFCMSSTYPSKFDEKWKCHSCHPVEFKFHDIHLLCKLKNQTKFDKKKFKVVKRMYRLVKNCSCQQYICGNRINL